MFYPSITNHEVFKGFKDIRPSGNIQVGDVAYVSNNDFRIENCVFYLGVCEIIFGDEYTFRLFDGKLSTVRFPSDDFKVIADNDEFKSYLNKII